MDLVPMSRREIEAAPLQSGEPAVAICLAYPNGRLHKVNAYGALLAVLHLRFSDCDERGAWCFPEGKEDDRIAIPMTRGQAVDVVDFVERWRDQIETIYSACYGGVSRSRGLLAGLAAVYDWNDEHIYGGGHPNAWVKSLIRREGHARGIKPARAAGQGYVPRAPSLERRRGAE